MPASKPDAIAVYIHWPFCQSKCPYCDFNSHVRDQVDQERWRKALLREIDWFAGRAGVGKLSSVFFGGGTPSLMPPATVNAVLERIESHWKFPAGLEITLEANPSSVEAARFADLKAAGVNRLSIGIQSFSDARLRFLGRRHDAAEARKAIAIATDIFDRVSLDLIYATPEQTAEDWRAELVEALNYGTGHLSLYQLTIENGTAFERQFNRGDFLLPAETVSEDLFDLTQDVCEAAGRPAYEISNHALPGEECRHNLNYWRGGHYLGIGPGAHGRLQIAGQIVATRQWRRPENWLSCVEEKGYGTEAEEPVTLPERAEEKLMMGFRLKEGIDRDHLGLSWPGIVDEEKFLALLEGGYLSQSASRVQTTPKGRKLLNTILKELLA